MCVLWLIGLMVLGVAFSPLIALLFGVGAAVKSVQKKQQKEGAPAGGPESNRTMAVVVLIALLMLALFIGFLVVRYWMT